MITADPLHCQRKHAATIAEKGGDYLLQIKANQPKLFKHAQALDKLQNTPFLPKQKPDTDASKSAPFTPGQ
jgi:predicted transposase YbfD/YdcC